MKLPVFLLALACSLATLSARAQPGAWWPAVAHPTHPRTLLTPDQLPQVRASLRAPTAGGLYRGLWAGTQAAPPTDNTSASGRRARATFAKNAAFVVLLDRQPAADSLGPLPATTRAAQMQQVTQLLETLNPAVEPFASFSGTTYTEWQWRSKELIDYLIAYDLLRGAGMPDTALTMARQQVQTFAGNLYRESNKPFMGLYFYRQIKNNHTLMTAAALGMAAVVLNEASSSDSNLQPTNWANTALFHLDNVLWMDAQRQSDPVAVAGYAEGPYYFKYAFLNCLPFIRALGHFAPGASFSCTYNGTTRTIPNPYSDPRYARLYQWAAAITMPDGRLPALEDSYVDMAMPELALTGQARFTPTLALSKLSTSQLNTLQAQLRDATVDMRAAYLAALPVPTAAGGASLTHLPQSGNLIFRSGADSLAMYFHLYGKSGPAQDNSGGHSQADASSFILQAQGQLLALDAGYLSYARRSDVGQATNHNLVLVDGAGPTIGTSGAANDAAATLPLAFATPGLAFGEVRTAYRNATITRKALLVRNRYVLLADFAASSTPRTYTWQLHGYGLEGGNAATGVFQENFGQQQATWNKNGVQLLAHVATPGPATFGKATSVHELTYNTTENHTVLLVESPAVARTQFLTALYPSAAAPAATSFVTRSTTATAALSASSSGYQDAAFTQADTVQSTLTTLPKPLTADGLLTFLAIDSAGQATQTLLDQGTLLRYGPDTLLHTTRRATASWQVLGDGRYAGYVSRATTLVVPMAQMPAQVQGSALDGYTYNARTHQLSIRLRDASDVSVQTTARPLPVTLVQFGGRRGPAGVALRWQTAAEVNNQGFAVQRSTAASPGFTTIGQVPANGNGNGNGPASYIFTDTSAPAETVYYRLQQQDTDGTVAYSGVVALGPVTAPLMLQPAPVPADAEVRVVATGLLPAATVLELLDARGRPLRQLPLLALSTLTTAALPAGIYYLRALDKQGRPAAPAVRIVVTH
ncbi:heparinase II/III domain-containing protein [Hymenobacter sp. 102]|uniref:heparinase II/III domain-containing protein n=1 Tax=Hymenobacter sp. 102 TaxID=3403152 RepID=UPI003CF4266E